MALTEQLAGRFARLALACVQREYPAKIAHAMTSDAQALPPRRLTPAFYGCYDWHSAVHGHWLLARVARLFPGADFAKAAREALSANITAASIAGELSYFRGEGRAGFERPYGWAWLLTLATELEPRLREILKPLEDLIVERFGDWLPKLPFPVRAGEHSNTAFALGLALDYARAAKLADLEELLVRRALAFYLADRACPMAWEPSGEDFLSPCLAEADLMHRVLTPQEYGPWLTGFLPDLSSLRPASSPDPSDGKLSHLNGLNLSRAWMLLGAAHGLPENDPRRPYFAELAEAHAAAGLASVTEEHYEGSHWLGTFAVYLLLSKSPTTQGAGELDCNEVRPRLCGLGSRAWGPPTY